MSTIDENKLHAVRNPQSGAFALSPKQVMIFADPASNEGSIAVARERARAHGLQGGLRFEAGRATEVETPFNMVMEARA